MSRSKFGAVGPPPEFDELPPLKVGCVYEMSRLRTGVIELFDPSLPGWLGMGESGHLMGKVSPGDTFIAVDRVETASVATNELWIILCNGILGKCIISEWELEGILEISEGESL